MIELHEEYPQYGWGNKFWFCFQKKKMAGGEGKSRRAIIIFNRD